MSKKGFTLVELLGVIVLLGVIIGIAVPSVMAINNVIHKNMLEKKLEVIEHAAILYGQDNKSKITNENLKRYTDNDVDYPCMSIMVDTLVMKGYLDKDNENSCSSNPGCIVDPTDKEKFLDSKGIIIYYKNKRIYAVVDYENKLKCE